MRLLKNLIRKAKKLIKPGLGLATWPRSGWTKVSTVASTQRRGPKAVSVDLSYGELREAERILRRERTDLALAERLQVVLLLHSDSRSCVSTAARRSHHDRKYVQKWRDRFLRGGLEGLSTAERSGRPPRIGAVSRCQVVALACGKPKEFGIPYRDTWTLDSLTEAYEKERLKSQGLDALGRTSVFRILSKAEIKPHRIKMWLHSPDPLFPEKVTDICSLYLSEPTAGVHIVCVDEKTGMQALGRKHAGRLLVPGQDARMDYEYKRNGTRKLIAGWDVQTGKVFAQVRARRTAADLVEFMDALAAQYPEGEVHIIWDNLNIHHDGPSKRWTEFNRRHRERFHFHYTPIHASWVNQVELWFGIFHRRVLRYGVFNSLEELDQAVLGFIAHWNKHEAHPFKWNFKGYPLQTGRKAG